MCSGGSAPGGIFRPRPGFSAVLTSVVALAGASVGVTMTARGLLPAIVPVGLAAIALAASRVAARVVSAMSPNDAVDLIWRTSVAVSMSKSAVLLRQSLPYSHS